MHSILNVAMEFDRMRKRNSDDSMTSPIIYNY